MKVKHITLCLVLSAGVACAASVAPSTYSDSLKEQLRVSWDFETNGSPSYIGDDCQIGSGWQNLPTVEDGHGVVNSSSGTMYHTGLTGNSNLPGRFDSSSFTISLDVNGLTLNSAGSSPIFNISCWNNSSANGQNPILLKANSNKELVLTLDGQEVITTGVNVDSLEWTTVTLTSSKLASNASNQTLSLYINGEKKGDCTGWIGSQNIDAMQIGAILGGAGSSVSSMQIDNLSLWNRALSETEIKSLVVPEPTTAMLSLLALAGGALRRRRQ